jgi:hypothetical protein
MTLETHETDEFILMAHETISVSEAVVVGIIVERLTTWQVRQQGPGTLVSIAEYRAFVGDHTSTDQRITERLQYLEAFCRNIIRPALQKIYEQGKETVIE